MIAAAAISLLMAVLWGVQRRTGNAGIVDVAWAGNIGLAGLFFAATGSGDPTSRWLAAVLAAVWSGRLTWYLFRRVVGHPEEGRYVTLRAEMGRRRTTPFLRFLSDPSRSRTVFRPAVPGTRQSRARRLELA
jgi:steroid 5-alpha reductase family enzyme